MRRDVIALDEGPDDETAWNAIYPARRLALTWISYRDPKVAKIILNGQQPPNLSATHLMALSKDLPHDWAEQRDHFGIQSV